MLRSRAVGGILAQLSARHAVDVLFVMTMALPAFSAVSLRPLGPSRPRRAGRRRSRNQSRSGKRCDCRRRSQPAAYDTVAKRRGIRGYEREGLIRAVAERPRLSRGNRRNTTRTTLYALAYPAERRRSETLGADLPVLAPARCREQAAVPGGEHLDGAPLTPDPILNRDPKASDNPSDTTGSGLTPPGPARSAR